MTGTTDLSIEQFETIARSIAETRNPVVRIVITPVTDARSAPHQSVVVKQYSLCMGDVLRLRYAVLRDGKRVVAPDEHEVAPFGSDPSGFTRV